MGRQLAKINLFVYSYKNKNLKLVVETAIKNCSSDIEVVVKDQHPIDRSEIFNDDRVVYDHEFWDHIYSPILFKKKYAHKSSGDYYCIISDDILLSPGWDKKAISLCSDTSIVSGMGSYLIDDSDKFLIKLKRDPGPSQKTGLCDSNFIFGKTEIMAVHDYPDYLKFHGEDLAQSLNFFLEGVEIFSLDEDTYKELNNKTLLNTYVPFSLQHGYNRLIQTICGKISVRDNKNTVDQFVEYFKIDTSRVSEFPHQYDDVLYDPNDFLIETSRIGGERFSHGLRSIQ